MTNGMKWVLGAAALLFLIEWQIGCGAPLPEDELGLDSTELAFSANTTPGQQFGVRTASSRVQCNRSTAGQVCTIPETRNPTYYLEALSRPQAVRDLLVVLDGTLAQWSFTETTDIGAATVIVEDDLGCSGGPTGSSIANFGCVNLTGTGKNLAEGAGVVGQYTTHTFGVIHIDRADCNTKYAAALDRNRCYDKAFAHAWVAWMGLGSRAGAPLNSMTTDTMTVTGALTNPLISAGEDCRAESLSLANNGNYTQPGACPTE